MSSDESIFPAASRADWAQMVSALLKGAAPQSLDRVDEDGLPLHTLYDLDDLPDSVNLADMPGLAGEASRFLPQNPGQWVRYGWDICQPITLTGCDEATVKAANTRILAALETGASSIWLTASTDVSAAVSSLFDQVVLSAIGITIDAGAHSQALFQACLALVGDNPASLHLACAATSDDALGAGLANAAHGGAKGVFVVDGWAWHNQGVTAVTELGASLAGMAAILRAGHAAEHDLGDLVSKTAITVALPADMFAAATKLRALRQSLAGLFDALGLDPADQPRLVGRPSLRMASLLDQDENILRNTTAMLGGAIGGVDAMAAFGHDYLSAESEAGRRLARLTQVMMIAESGLASSLDPAAGAPFIESRTRALAQAAWQCFQTIETAGGLPAFVDAGGLAALAETANDRRAADLRSGRVQLVGVNLQPAPAASATALATSKNALATSKNIVRPAALIESLRRRAGAASRRILILQAVKPDKEQVTRERGIKRLLGIAGLQPVVLPAGDDFATGLDAARPEIVIDCGETGLEDLIVKPAGCRWFAASALLAHEDQLAMLEMMLEIMVAGEAE